MVETPDHPPDLTPGQPPGQLPTLPTWGICVQVKAPLAAVETFLAWHLELGADRIAVYFDDPDDPAADAVAGLDRVLVQRCDADHWHRVKGVRPEKKTVRQTCNALDEYRRSKVGWLAHIDIDEFLLPLGPVGDALPWNRRIAGLLARVPADRPFERLRPHEALAEPLGGEPRHFRTPPRGPGRAQVAQGIYGSHAVGLDNGMLSHSVGKSISRTGITGFQPRLHVPRLQGEKFPAQDFCDDIALLHYHANDRAHWLDMVDYRARLGAYSGRDATRSFFLTASPEALVAFHDAVQVAHPALLARLEAAGLLLQVAPHLQQARARVFPGTCLAPAEEPEGR